MAENDTEIKGSKTNTKKYRHGIGVIEIEPNNDYLMEVDSHSNVPKTSFSRSEVHHMCQSYPFGFRTPENCSSSVCRWVYPITFGGGLVGGDEIQARFVIGQKCCVVVCTQETTKVYHTLQTEKTTTQQLNFVLKENSLLCVLPDPLVCYRDARFYQKQTFRMHPSSNLVFLDWLLAGRKALGEWWDFQRYCSTIEIFFNDQLVLRECNDLENDHEVALTKSMGNFEFLGTCIILGPHLTPLLLAMEEKYGAKKGFGEKHSDHLVVSLSPLSYNVQDNQIHGCYIRFLAANMKEAAVLIRDITNPLLNDLGADPFERKL